MTEAELLLARIDGLEMRIAYQDQTIEDLNGAISDLWKRIEEMAEHIGRLRDQVREVESSVGVAEGPEQPPPHY